MILCSFYHKRRLLLPQRLIQMGNKSRTKYPGESILYCMSLCRKLNDEIGRTDFIPLKAIASVLGMKEKSISRKVAACRYYGLMEMEQGGGYMLAERFLKLDAVARGPAYKQALQECLGHTQLFAKLINKYQGAKLPKEKHLAELLAEKHAMLPTGAATAAKVFWENVRELNLINDYGELWLEPETEDVEPQKISQPSKATDVEASRRSRDLKGMDWSNSGEGVQRRIYGITGGRQVELQFEGRFNKQDLDLLVEHLLIEIRNR